MAKDEMVGITYSVNMSWSKLQETGKPGLLQSMGLQRVRHDLVSELQQHVCVWLSRYLCTRDTGHCLIQTDH